MQRVDMRKPEAPEGFGKVIEGPKPKVSAVKPDAEASPDEGSATPSSAVKSESEAAPRKAGLPAKRSAPLGGDIKIKPRGPETWAQLLAVLWIIGGIVLIASLQLNGSLAESSIADWLLLLIGIAAPVGLLFLAGEIVKRAGDMRRAALFLGRTASRLLEPDQGAAKEMNTLSSAIRGEITRVSEALEQAVRRASQLETMIQEQSKALDKTADRMDERARSVGTLLDSQRAKIDASAKGLSVEARVIAETIDSGAGAISKATASAADQLKSVQASLAERTRALDTAAITAVRRTHDAAKGLDEQTHRLESITDSALEKAETITAKYAAQHRAMSEAAADLAKENQQLDKVLENQRHMLARIAETFEGQAKKIETTIKDCVTDLGEAIDGADGKSAEIADGFTSRIERITRAGELAADTVKKAGEAARTSAEQSTKGINTQAALSRETLENYLRQAREALAGLVEESGTAITQHSENASDGLREQLFMVKDQIQTQVDQTREAFDALEGNLETVLTRNMKAIDKAVLDAEDRLESLAGRVADRIARLTGETAESVESLKAAADDLGSRLSALPDRADESAAKLREALSDQIGEISRMADTAVEKARALSHTVETESPLLLDTPLPNEAPSHRDPVPYAWDDQDTADASRGPRKAAPIKTAEDLARRIVPRLKPIDDLDMPRPSTRTEEPREARERDIRTSSRATGEGLGWREILKKADEASSADKEREREREQESDASDKARASLRVVETLQAMAIDLDRALEEDPPADLLQRYLNGERNVFARRLSMLGGPELADRIHRKYNNEPEFRHDVNRYIGEFESLLDTVTRGDRENILAETYLTSQTGKVYLMLIKAIGHKP